MTRKKTAPATAVTATPEPSLGVYDSLLETISGTGYSLLATHQHKGFGNYLSRSTWEIECAVAESGVMDTYINRPAEDAMANPLVWLKLSEKQKTKVVNWLAEYDFNSKVEEAAQAERSTGFAAIWMDTGAADTTKPMRPGELSRLKELVVLDANCLVAERNSYAMHQTPKSWRVTDTDVLDTTPEIHASRLLIFPGFSPSRRARYMNGGKGFPAATRIWKSWRAWEKMNATSPNIAETYEEPTLYMEGLNKKLGIPEGAKQIRAKATDFELTRRATRLAVLDSTERYERPGPPIGGLADIHDRATWFFVANSGFPYSILLGKLQASGIGGKGAADGDEQEWAKFIARYQRKSLMKPITQFLGLLKQSVFRTLDLSFEFPPLHQQTEQEWEAIATSQNKRLTEAKNSGWLSLTETREIAQSTGLYPNIDPAAPPDEPAVMPGPIPPQDPNNLGDNTNGAAA